MQLWYNNSVAEIKEDTMKIRQPGLWVQVMPNIQVETSPGDRWVVCRHTCSWQPLTDVYKDNDGAVVRIELAGMHSDDFSITLTEIRTETGRLSKLVITGTRVDSISKQIYYQMEIPFGEFRAEVHLPWTIEPEEVEASYEEGFLTVRLPRPRERRVPVITADNTTTNSEVKPEEDH